MQRNKANKENDRKFARSGSTAISLAMYSSRGGRDGGPIPDSAGPSVARPDSAFWPEVLTEHTEPRFWLKNAISGWSSRPLVDQQQQLSKLKTVGEQKSTLISYQKVPQCLSNSAKLQWLDLGKKMTLFFALIRPPNYAPRGFEMYFGDAKGIDIRIEKKWNLLGWKKCCWLLGRLSELVALRLST